MNNQFQQVAALVCLDLDTLLEVSKNKKLTIEELREQIELTHSMKEAMIKDADLREKRFNAVCSIFNLIGVNDVS